MKEKRQRFTDKERAELEQAAVRCGLPRQGFHVEIIRRAPHERLPRNRSWESKWQRSKRSQRRRERQR